MCVRPIKGERVINLVLETRLKTLFISHNTKLEDLEAREKRARVEGWKLARGGIHPLGAKVKPWLVILGARGKRVRFHS